ncbi:MAG: DoxX family protein [Bacteroidota bacterium]
MKKFKIIYWIATGLITLMIGLGSFADIFMIDAMRESIQHQGFPVPFLPFFGIAKLMAVIVILVPALKWLKLSAYVGLFWYFAGAVYSHFAVGDPFAISAGAIIAFILVLVSYFSWRKMEQLSLNA